MSDLLKGEGTDANGDPLTTLRSLAESLDRMESTAQRMVSREYVESWQRSEERKRRSFALLVVGVGVCFLLMFVLFGLGLAQLTTMADTNRENTTLLVECTAPSLPGDRHECYERGQKSTGEAISSIVTQVKAGQRQILREVRRQNRLRHAGR